VYSLVQSSSEALPTNQYGSACEPLCRAMMPPSPLEYTGAPLHACAVTLYNPFMKVEAP
jgi:hypothetical protein